MKTTKNGVTLAEPKPPRTSNNLLRAKKNFEQQAQSIYRCKVFKLSLSASSVSLWSKPFMNRDTWSFASSHLASFLLFPLLQMKCERSTLLTIADQITLHPDRPCVSSVCGTICMLLSPLWLAPSWVNRTVTETL